jgi:excisionase family DNA binding protein
MTVSEAARYLRVTRSTIYRWSEEGRLRFFQLEGGTRGRRWNREDLDALLREGRVGAAPEGH